jgi:hypothetical protein
MLNNLAALLDQGVAPATNSYESIATVSVGSGGQSSVEFTSIPSTYKHLQIRYIARQNAAGADRGAMEMQFNADTATNYSCHLLYGDGSSAASTAYVSNSFIYTGLSDITAASAGSNIFGVGVIDILDYANTNKYKTSRTLAGQDQNNTSGRLFFSSGSWRNTNAITSIKLFPESGSYVQYSQLALYGIKG